MAERRRLQQVRADEKFRKELERKAAAAQRAKEHAARASAREQAAADREVKRLYAEARQAAAALRTADAQALLEEYEGLLRATLDVDDFVDLESLRQSEAAHPPFKSENAEPLQPPRQPVGLRPKPVYAPPPKPSGMFGQRKHAQQVSRYEAAYRQDSEMWRMEESSHHALLAAWQSHERAEVDRLDKLAGDRMAYDEACRDRERSVSRDNAELDQLIAEFNAGTTEAVEEYFSIVLQNSVYPDGFPLGIAYDVDVSEKEMTIYLDLPRPDQMPSVKAYKYVKARDEIDPVPLTLKEQRDLYGSVLAQVCVRTLHELFEADRADHLHSVSLTAGVTHVDPATGNDVQTYLLSVAAGKAEFESFNLSNVDPAETLRHIGAVISKNPAALTPIPDASGARTRR